MALQIILFMPKNKHTVSIYEPNIRHLTKHILSKLQAKTDLLIKKDCKLKSPQDWQVDVNKTHVLARNILLFL